jgi:hypothetical protein
MQFNVDSDQGASISGWVVPDNPSAVPKFMVAAEGSEPVAFDANAMRPDIKDLGMHRTGMVGFAIDGRIFPGLAEARNVRIWET